MIFEFICCIKIVVINIIASFSSLTHSSIYYYYYVDQDKGQNIFLYDRATIVPLTKPEDLESTASATTITNSSSTLFIPPPIDMPSEPKPEPEGFSSHLEAASSSPLLQTIANFERQFMLALNKGEVLSDASKKWVEDTQAAEDIAKIRHAALLAAKSNLQFHMDELNKMYNGGATHLELQHKCHSVILDRFNEDLELLGRIRLHPALASSSKGRFTLLDCVPVDKERALHESCQQSHRRMEVHEKDMIGAWDRLKADVLKLQEREIEHIPEHWSAHSSSSSRGGGGGGSSTCEGEGNHEEGEQDDGGQSSRSSIEWEEGDWLLRAKKDAVDQEFRRLKLQKNYDAALAMAERQLGLEQLEDDANISMEAIQELNELFTGQRGLIPDMLSTDKYLRKAVGRGREVASMSAKALIEGLKEIARLQNNIQEVQSWLRFMRAASDQKDDQFSHLEKLQRMPSAYNAFKNEIVRRRAYSSVFKAQVSEAVDSIAALRSREIVARDVFRRCHLVNLPVLFLEIAPGLCEQQPPHFDPMVKESTDTAARGPAHLPPIHAADIGTTEEDARKAVRDSSGDDLEDEADQNQTALKTDEGDDEEQEEEILISSQDVPFTVESTQGAAALQYENALLRAEVIRLKQYLKEIGGGSNAHSAEAARVMVGIKGQRSDGDDVNTLKQSSDEGEELNDGEEISHTTISKVTPTKAVMRRSQSENEMCSALRCIERSTTAHVAAIESPSASNPMPSSWPSRTSSGRLQSSPASNKGQGGECWADIAKLVDTALQRSRQSLKRVTMEVQLQAEENDSLQEALKSAASFRITFQSFSVNDLVLFLPSENKNECGERIYRAFHANCRNYFLSKKNVNQAMEDSKGGAFPEFILGKVIDIEMHTVGESDDVEAAEFQLEYGTSVYYVLTIAPWNDEPPPPTIPP